ncbi:RluA family pseudouridine synthase [Alkalihalobacillus sp. MEB130]|uniref:RluA family pseudouridine synthase n=1 Tax=Alkalihalobacillus sp. MEB130 TaxID=2976704 RepID=UPI0028DDA284|nr:RluA family pseudouridine synthase [Alkalihalobacillus sp. MEB130]MDT8862748.1 RluA family pseudouridine synthase [Alkalihalobacillus sp. MEB130]
MNKYVANVTWKVDEDWDQELLRPFLRERCHISKKGLAQIKHNGGSILVNEKEVTVRQTIQTGDEVTICLPAEQASSSMEAEEGILEILYEDDHLLVINKQAGIPTIPSREHLTHTLANFVLGYYKKRKIPATFHAVNRLDKDTSGALIVAKHRIAHDRLSKLQQAGAVNRYYRALVTGELSRKKGTIEAPIGRDPNSIITRQVREDGKRAVTHYSVQSETSYGSFVHIKLETGRTHQIRVHFSYIGHPLLGDDLYGGKHIGITRQALHCGMIEFQHPFTGEKICRTCELPEDMRRLL